MKNYWFHSNLGDITFDPSDYENEELREAFIDYFTSVLRLLRGSENRAETVAGKIWSLEKRLAEIQDSEEVFTKSTVDDVQEPSRRLDWSQRFTERIL